MEQRRPTTQSASLRPSAEQVADLLEVVRTTNARLASEVCSILRSRAHLGHTTVYRLEQLAHDVRPAAAARQSLAELEPALLMEGTALWMRRGTSRARAEQRCSGRMSA